MIKSEFAVKLDVRGLLNHINNNTTNSNKKTTNKRKIKRAKFKFKNWENIFFYQKYVGKTIN